LKSLERVKGIEPSYSAWKAAALPLSYTRVGAIHYHAGPAASTSMRRIGPLDKAPANGLSEPAPIALGRTHRVRELDDFELEPVAAVAGHRLSRRQHQRGRRSGLASAASDAAATMVASAASAPRSRSASLRTPPVRSMTTRRFLRMRRRADPLTCSDSMLILMEPSTMKGGDPVSYTKRCHLAGIAR
jgi:hypothetical protein